MDFTYTPEQTQLRNMVREFATAEIGPHVSEWDEQQIFPLEAIKKAGQLGLLNVRNGSVPSGEISEPNRDGQAAPSRAWLGKVNR